ncbi:MAG: TIGR03087 family PEP-CTERM/XrtA system glycosyltransferase [Acetobacteraceae bacterium]
MPAFQAAEKPPLLFLTQRLPYPPIRGEKIRSYKVLAHLAARYRIFLGCLADEPVAEADIAAMRALCDDVHIAPIDRRTARLACLTGLVTGDALSVRYFHDSGLARWVRGTVAKTAPEIVFVYSSNMAPYVLDLPRTGRCVVDLVDVDSEKWRAYARAARGPMRLVYRREWRRVRDLEERIARDCDMSILVSATEAGLAARHAPRWADRIVGISNGVDHDYFDPALPCPPPFDPSVPTFVFTGTMDYPPNVDAVTWFTRDILPVIRRTHPQASFCIVGNNPSAAVQALAATPGVQVTGRVPDVRPYLAHAAASVAPMRIARGIQNKVLEAMAMAKPVIVTSGALEGIDALPGAELLLADEAEAFAKACCQALDAPHAERLGRAARARVLHSYDWAAQLARYDDVLDPVRLRATDVTITPG